MNNINNKNQSLIQFIFNIINNLKNHYYIHHFLLEYIYMKTLSYLIN